MKVLVLSFYFSPDLSAGSFRTTSLVSSMSAAAPDASIEVLTALPNRYHSFSVDVPAQESRGNVAVHRFALPAHRSGMLDQSHSFLSFARQVLRYVRGRRYDIVYATSSRLLTASLGALVAGRTRARLYLDIRDIFVDTIGDVLAPGVRWLVQPAFAALERWTMRRADHINLVSRGFAEYFTSRYPGVPLSFHTNGIDDEFLAPAGASEPRGPHRSKIDILYAGNLGEGQGLHAIVPALALALRGRARFRIIGDGGRREVLQRALIEAGTDNVEWLPPMRRDALIEAYRDADVLFLHLNDYNAFKKVLPSKIFEYAAIGKPIWAGVAGYAADFIRTEITNAAVFAPCDAAQALQVFEQLDLRDTPRADFIVKFSRARIMSSLVAEVLALGETQRLPAASHPTRTAIH
jgi:hypothetical protein